MLNLIISTGAFFVAAWLANRYLDELELAKSMARGLLVFVIASIVSWARRKSWTGPKLESKVPRWLRNRRSIYPSS